MSAAAVSCIFMTAAGVAQSSAVNLVLLGLSLWMMWNARTLLGKGRGANGWAAFTGINIYMVFVTLVLAADRFL